MVGDLNQSWSSPAILCSGSTCCGSLAPVFWLEVAASTQRGWCTRAEPPAAAHFTHKLVNAGVSMFAQLPFGCLCNICRKLQFPVLGWHQDTFARRGIWEIKIQSEINCLGWASSEEEGKGCIGEVVYDCGYTSSICFSFACQETAISLWLPLFSRKSRDKTCWE